jgi:hypothetical protein
MWLWGQVMGLLITAAVANLYLRTKQDKFPAFDTPVFMNRQEFWQFSLPLAAAALLMWFQWNSWRPIVQSHFGTEQLGAMLAGYLLASYFWGVVEGTTHQALHPSFFAKTHHRADVSKQAYQDFVCVLAPLYGLTASLAITLSPWIVLLMPGRQFHLAPLFFAWGVVIELCRVLTGLLMHTAQIRKTSYATIPPYLAGIFVGLVCVSAIQFFHAWTVFTLTSSVLASALAVLWAALWINKDYFVPSDLPRSSYLIGGVLLISCAIAAFGLLHPTDGLTTLSLAAFGSLGVAIVAHRVWGEIQVTYHRLTSIGSDIP